MTEGKRHIRLFNRRRKQVMRLKNRREKLGVQPIQRVEIIHPNTASWRFWIRPVFLWRVFELIGLGATVWALFAAIESNELTRES